MESTAQSAFTFLNLIFLFISFLPSFQAKLPSTSTSPLPTEALPTSSGYLPVNPSTGSAIFYAFYEAQHPASPLTQTPLLIWLQGGPGCSSLLGNFYELGPWRVTPHRQNVEHLALEINPGSWNRIFGLVFLDSPIGTGFSIASSTGEIPKDQNSVAKHLFAAITRFVALDPSFKSRPIYITGESYAGKYVPAIGYYILKRNAQSPASHRVNLAGVAIGNGLTDPAVQVATHAANAYFSGLINEKQRLEMEKAQLEAVKLTLAGNWSEATNARNHVLNLLQKMTGLATLYDFRRPTPYETKLVTEFLKSRKVKAALGVNETMVWEECSVAVGTALHEDVMKSVKFMVEFLVKKTRVLLYQGQCDLRDGVVSTEAWVKRMKWKGIEKFLAADRKVWNVNGSLAGYVQKWGSLSHAVVLGAGHLVPADQPLNSQAMIEDWVLNRGLFGSELEEQPKISRNSL
ncbi:serine carboxypeptidase-like 50 [Malania oleifera]|uniref:serine carboxypeptidase-like 50 n=1 Tax=Malania oleifera TaxID=397392 RepID=UPI0025ADCD51|nr:serine carboxypeptidase-like 50 [Malania oleifera]